MARVKQGEQNLNTNGTSVTTNASFTPPATCVIYAALWSRVASGTNQGHSSITDTVGGLTWTKHAEGTATDGTSKVRCTIWSAVTGASPPSGTVTGNFAGTVAQRAISVWTDTAINTGTPVTSGHTGNLTNGTSASESVTLANAPASSASVVAIIVSQGASNITAGGSGGFTEDVEYAFPARCQMQQRTGSTSTTVDWGGCNTTANAAAIVEFNAAGSAPAAPSALTATVMGANRVDLAWTDNASDELNFTVERAPDSGGSPGSWTVLSSSIAANATGFSDTAASPTTAYWYRAKATNAAGSSTYATTGAAVTTRALPTVTIDLPSGSQTFLTGTSVGFSCTPADADGDVTVAWSSSIDGALSTATTFATEDLTAGNHTIACTVTDEDGDTAADTVAVVVTSTTAGTFVRKTKMADLIQYGVQQTVTITLFDTTGTPVQPSLVAGDVKVSKDGGAAANVTNLPTAGTNGDLRWVITAAEATAKTISFKAADQDGPAWVADVVEFRTFGNVNAFYPTVIETLGSDNRSMITADAHTAGAMVAGIQGGKNQLDDLNDIAASQVLVQAAQALSDYDGPTNTELATALAAADDAVLTAIGDVPTNAELAAALAALNDLSVVEVAAAVGGRVIEGGYTADELLRGMAVALLGMLSGAGTTTITVRDLADTKDRITATVDEFGNRVTVTYDLS